MPETFETFAKEYLKTVKHNFQTYKTLADKSLAQLKPMEWHKTISPESNSVAIIVQHLIGNLQSRFTDFLTTDGEKPTRNRDAEFENTETIPETLFQNWEAAWNILFDLLENLQPSDLNKTITIRNEPHTVISALNRQVAHYAYHVGQIVLLAKYFRNKDWKTLSIAKGKSEVYNATMNGR